MDLRKICEDAGAKVLTANNQGQALKLTDNPGVTVAVIDYTLAEMSDALASSDQSHVSLADRLTELDIPYIFCSARHRDVAFERPTIRFVAKPFLAHEIVDALVAAMTSKKLRDRSPTLTEEALSGGRFTHPHH